MNKTRNILSLIIGVLLFYIIQPAFALVLVDNHKPVATIIISKDAPRKNRFAAKELQKFIKLMSGAELPIVEDSNTNITGKKILVGESAYTRPLKLNIPTGFSYHKIKEGFIIKAIGDNLVLLGNDGGLKIKARSKWHLAKSLKERPHVFYGGLYKGTLFAVYAFLEKLGCRWYFPGEFGQVVPKRKTVNIDKIDVKEVPSFLLRGYWTHGSTVQVRKEDDLFYLRSRFLPYDVDGSLGYDGSLMRIIKWNKKYWKTNPEYFALRKDGTRNPHNICMSNPQVIKLITEACMDHFKKNPDANGFGFSPADGEPICWCKNCQKLNGHIMKKAIGGKGNVLSISGAYYHLFTHVAEKVMKKYPSKALGTSVYAGRYLPPPSEYKFPQNVFGSLAFLDYSAMRPIGSNKSWQAQQLLMLLESWGQRLKKMVYRPYCPSFMYHCNMPIPATDNIIKNVAVLKKINPLGMKWEGWSCFNVSFINFYLRGKLLWNANADGKKVLDDFYNTFYGPAGVFVRDFYENLEKAIANAPFDTHEEELIPEFYTYPLIKKLSANVKKAEKAVKNHSAAIKQRVYMFRLSVEHMLAYAEMRGVAERNRNYKRAAELASKMLVIEKKMMEICPSFIDINQYRRDKSSIKRNRFCADFTALGKKTQYENILKLMNGTDGELVVWTPKKWKFRTDELNSGLTGQWFYQNTNTKAWDDIEVGRCWEVQGYTNLKNLKGYTGCAWYKCDVKVPKKFVGRKISIFYGGINNEAWIWVNGKLMHHQAYHAWWSHSTYSQIIDISSAIKAGNNNITIRVLADDKFGFGGVFRDVFLFSPNKIVTIK